jgi:hypothetical protein
MEELEKNKSRMEGRIEKKIKGKGTSRRMRMKKGIGKR